ncbi:MAG: hypothetical protein ABI818_13115 [Acidobacteriota bacterium]
MWKRVALAVPVWYDPAPRAIYRLHEQSDTSSLMRTGRTLPTHAARLRSPGNIRRSDAATS